MQKQVFGKSAYSKADIAKLVRIGAELEEAKKDPRFVDSIRQFIRETT